ncbi:anaphase-promoting complex subunit CDC26-like [Sitophilus oryzae]|uniref:Anaphase-promoting complex subunit CDC26-like n=1 Tax=Sitophilus oryzae TaxID=7048 RepID=A0A6J2XM21_SITOR|nr:anaphase-promoting complex subunit CDC26-like [Sitophilus oryzae]
MLRRVPTAIEPKLDDITEYEQHIRKIRQEKLQKSLASDLPSFQTGPKSKQEVYNRIGYNPPHASV